MEINASVYANYDLYALSRGTEQIVFGEREADHRTRSVVLLERALSLVDVPSKGTMLDFGCGRGATLRAFSSLCPDWMLVGFEQNERFRDRVLSIPGVVGHLSGEPDRIPGFFDFISMVHVLEHLPDPRGVLQRLHTLLNPGGHLLIQVPNILENPFDLVVVDHYSHFSPRVLSDLANAIGFEVMCLATDWIQKEVTLLLRSGGSLLSESKKKTAGSRDAEGLPQLGCWLDKVIDTAAFCASGHELGIFGTAIAGTWLGSILDERVTFFVDEDSQRVGRHHLAKPVIHPSRLSTQQRVFLAFPYPMALRIYRRVSAAFPAKFYLPPEPKKCETRV
ncbi:MAG: class I SAM-dependent methyltransferase [Nitrospira sp.]|nr:MAG: class I SAM-dependent methyltransferase [Nitrospira sp.]